MSDLYNFHIPSSETEEKAPEITPQEADNNNSHKIRHIIHKNKADRSQSAPLEEANNDEDAEFLSSYNYYLFYTNKNPRDPHLPKPTYVPKPDLGDIKESKAKDEEDQPKINNDKQMETLNQMMNNLNLDKTLNMNFNKLLNDDFPDSINNNSKFGINNNNSNNNFNEFNNAFNSNNKSKLLNLNLNNNNNMDNINNNLPQNIRSDLFGDDNFILNNFVNNDNIKNIVPNNKQNLNSDNNNINNMGSNLSFNPNSVNNIYGSKGIGFNEFDIYNSNKLMNNNNVNNNNNLLNMMLLQNMQKDQKPNLNPNFNINYFNQQINNNNILLNNINNNSKQGNFEPNYNSNIPFQNNFQNANNNNNFMNFNNQNSKNYHNLFSKNQKRKFQNNNNNFNNFNNRNQNMNNINPKFFPPKNQKNNNLKNIAGLSDFTNSQKRDLTDIKHLEELIQSANNIQSKINNSGNINKNIDDISQEGMKDIMLLNKYKADILNLSKDVTGNYAIQKVLNNKKLPEVNFIIESLKNNIYKLTLNLYGCRCVQELISILNVENMHIITNELKPFYDNCIQDKNGNHVIQKLIEKVDSKDLNDIYLVAVNNIIYLSKHQYGCRVIQRLFKYCNKSQIKNMLNNLFKNINDLIQDQYGNYVIQFILENQEINKDDLLPIFFSLRGNIYQYSFHKYASNVVERCITFGNEPQKKEIINEIAELVNRDEEIIINMVRDKFANYVVQKIIEFSDGDMQQSLIKIILSRQNKIKNEGFSKHVLNFIEKLNSGNARGNKIKNNNIMYKPFK